MKKGFTLAEVLITLAVIGVVATLTLPNVIGNHQNKVLMTQLQKTINTVQNAALKSMEENAAESFYELYKLGSSRDNFLKTYIDTVSICSHKTGYTNCLAPTYTSFDKSNSASIQDVLDNVLSASTEGVRCAATTSGSTICMAGYTDFAGLKPNRNSYTWAIKFLVDVNGIKSPNVVGKDLFYFSILENGKLFFNRKDDVSYDNGTGMEARGDFCTASSIYPYDHTCLPYIISHGWQFKY